MPELFVIAPPDAETGTFIPRLERLLAGTDPAALLLLRGARDERTYAGLVKAVLPVAQPRDVAVLLEGEPRLVRRLGADGLHVSGDPAAVRDAIEALAPEFIVGAAAGAARHDAMALGELGVDYVFFGPNSGSIDHMTRELARWWAETMEVPGVLSDPQGKIGDEAEGCEFLALGAALWEHFR
jgi:thiamine-phosphate pyrophosphorylase